MPSNSSNEAPNRIPRRIANIVYNLDQVPADRTAQLLHELNQVERDFDINAPLPRNNLRIHARHQDNTLLHVMAQQSNIPAVRALLDLTADTNTLNSTGSNALHTAVSGGYRDAAIIDTYDGNPAAETVRLLLGAGANTTQQDNEGAVPLIIAMQGGFEVTNLLLEPTITTLTEENNLNVLRDYRDDEGNTALHYAYGGIALTADDENAVDAWQAIADRLIRVGCDPQTMNADGIQAQNMGDDQQEVHSSDELSESSRHSTLSNGSWASSVTNPSTSSERGI